MTNGKCNRLIAEPMKDDRFVYCRGTECGPGISILSNNGMMACPRPKYDSLPKPQA